jgi:hypothetical protein
MDVIKKFLSRRLLVLGVFGFVAPVLFQSMGIDPNITLASLALGASYMGQRALRG